MVDLLDQKQEMLEKQLKARGITNQRVLDAMMEVPREEFISKDLVEYAYRDAPLPIDEEQTISQPYIVALAAEILDIREDEKVLDVGTGSGYAAAVMSELGKEVYTIERHKSLAESASKRFERLGYDNIYILHGDGTEGWPEHAPFDAINVAAGGPRIPEDLKEQLAPGGRMVIPVGSQIRTQRLVLTTRNNGQFSERDLGRVQFVPLIGTGGWVNREAKEESPPKKKKSVTDRINDAAEPFNNPESADLSPLLERIGDARVVLIGEATHGTSEFYRLREQITRKLIEEKGFNIVSLEADWPDAAHIDRFVRDLDIPLPEEEPFTRFPTWMWNNGEVLRFVKWLKEYNEGTADPDSRTGVYGLDFYSMFSSIKAIVDYLEDLDPSLAEIARNRYGCLSPYENDPTSYGAAAMSDEYRKCEKEVTEMLRRILTRRIEKAEQDGTRYLDALQNARLVANAEKYYRSMYFGAQSSWNLRDTHMFKTLTSLMDHRGDDAKAVVWAHNSHVGDARATEMGARGEHNIGQLAKEHFEEDAYNIGFGTDHGTVAAAHNWGGRMRVMDVRPSHNESLERLMHRAEHDNFLLPLHKEGHGELTREMEKSRLERAIGVIYRPGTEMQSHYFQASLSNQFDEYIWFDETRAINPLPPRKKEKGVPETYPFGL
ncbi:protein-L-isoaspartate(D-aspartate) O-methyltransferase [Rhodohalobacter mucosus]|uniref:Protein-L-isoaspartate O-methyltransferase n=1 Tax=Rhodohalobacter mucosus TaxID=2079485 RepID=A0A316TS70_9BACT|nr:protein-L-isoaspartate(D-aspartate) O-methyltransferase [Rhodohalobacter mucosus]PWN06481.1 protein-L-isoaspartate O-methyltransferase [Rhodohalobacter mucosus]